MGAELGNRKSHRRKTQRADEKSLIELQCTVLLYSVGVYGATAGLGESALPSPSSDCHRHCALFSSSSLPLGRRDLLSEEDGRAEAAGALLPQHH